MYQDLLQQLYIMGMHYAGVPKVFCGKVDLENFFGIPTLATNQFGYYERNDGSWIVFVTDDERGIETYSHCCQSEESAVQTIISLAEGNNIAHLSRVIVDSLEDRKSDMNAYLKQEFGLSEQNALMMTECIYQIPDVAFEFFYYMEKGCFVPDKYACCFRGYTAKRLFTEHSMSLPGAFQYMVFLRQNPTEALLELQSGIYNKQAFL